MKLFVVAITFAVTMGGLFLFENHEFANTRPNYAQIVKNIQSSSTPIFSKSPIVSTKPKKSLPTSAEPRKPITSPSPKPSPTPVYHTYYTSSSSSAKYYYCDTDSGWKSLSKNNLKQFSSPEELLKLYPTRNLHEACKN